MTRRANIAVLLVFIILTVLEYTAKSLIPHGSIKYIAVAVIEILVLVIPTVILFKSQNRKAITFLRLKRFKFRWIPLIFVSSLMASLGGILLNILLSGISLKFKIGSTADTSAVASPEAMVASFAALVIVPAIVEEIFFRGAVLSSFELKNIKSGVIASSILFGILHSSPSNFFGPFLAGLTYALLTVVFDSVYPAMLAHFINNAMSSMILYYSKLFLNIGLEFYIIVFIFILFLLLLYLSLKLVEPYLVKKSVFIGQEDSELKQRINKRSHSPVFSITFFITVILWIVKMALKIAGVI